MKSTLHCVLMAVVASSLAGCATSNSASKEKEKKDGTVLAEAPLGSRIRKKSEVNPVAGINRDDIDRAKVQQNAMHSAAYNDPKGVVPGK